MSVDHYRFEATTGEGTSAASRAGARYQPSMGGGKRHDR